MTELRTVDEIMAEHAAAAGIDIETPNDLVEAAVPFLVTQLDMLLPPLAEDPHALRVLALALRSYADVAEEYAAAKDREQSGAVS